MKASIDIKDMKWNAEGLICAIAQEAATGDVLMQAYMNEESLEKTLETGYMHYFSRSRNKLWKKGEESGHVQEVVTLYYDCDKDAILAKIVQTGAACHTGNKSCFYTLLAKDFEAPDCDIINSVFGVIKDRKTSPVEGSYTNYLFNKGTDKICKKIGEEATETVIAAKNKDKKELTMELADLVYHAMVLMVNEGLELTDIYTELMEREGRVPLAKYKKL